tara:strand:+ start:2943 stop:3206 length:264 start_codon:yes stop_codon:yes gene_type:complete
MNDDSVIKVQGIDIVEEFTTDVLNEGKRDMILMGMTEDDLVLIKSIAQSILELTEIVGNHPSIELASLESRFTEALIQLESNFEEDF